MFIDDAAETIETIKDSTNEKSVPISPTNNRSGKLIVQHDYTNYGESP